MIHPDPRSVSTALTILISIHSDELPFSDRYTAELRPGDSSTDEAALLTNDAEESTLDEIR